MRVGPAGIGTLGDAHRLDAVGQHHLRHVLHVLEELLEPLLEVHAVPQHQVSVLRFDDVARAGLVAMDFGARLRDGFHDRGVARNVAGDVGDDGEGGDDLELVLRKGRPVDRARRAARPGQQTDGDQAWIKLRFANGS